VALLPEAGLLVVQQVVLAVLGHLVAHLGAAGHPVVLLVVPGVLLGVGHLVGPLRALPEGLAVPGAVVAAAGVVVVVVGLIGVPLRCFHQLGWIWASQRVQVQFAQ
jgi:hypothetical protein